MRLGISALVAALTITTAGAARATQTAAVHMPPTMEVDGKTLTLNGTGVSKAMVLNGSAYVAGLYVEQRSTDPTQVIASGETKRLVVHFVRTVYRTNLTDSFIRGYKHNATVPRDQIEPQIAQLTAWMHDFKDGDLLTFTFLPGEGLEVTDGAKTLGILPGDDFARSTLAIWLGENSHNKALEAGLLGKH